MAAKYFLFKQKLGNFFKYPNLLSSLRNTFTLLLPFSDLARSFLHFCTYRVIYLGWKYVLGAFIWTTAIANHSALFNLQHGESVYCECVCNLYVCVCGLEIRAEIFFSSEHNCTFYLFVTQLPALLHQKLLWTHFLFYHILFCKITFFAPFLQKIIIITRQE